MASSKERVRRGGTSRAAAPGRLTAGRLLLAALVVAAVATPVLFVFRTRFEPLPFAPVGIDTLGAIAAAVAAGLAALIALRASRLRSASTARWLSTALALDVYAISWGISFAESGALSPELFTASGLAARAAAVPYETWLVHGIALALIVGVARGAAEPLFARPFCLVCTDRCRPEGDSVECAAPPLGEVRERLEARDWRFFRPLGPPSRRGRGLRFRLFRCSCGVTSCFDLTLLRPLRRGRVLARSQILRPEEMRALRRVTYDILHPPRAADWLVPTQARIHRAVQGGMGRSFIQTAARSPTPSGTT